jgi:secreted trypsin-like serine protease|nr:S1 family serine peptidase-like protein [Tenebrio molitor]
MKNFPIFVSFILTFAATVKPEPHSRIIGGQPAPIANYKFAAAINVQKSNMVTFCGGALFENQWIITAGQCVDDAVLFVITLGSATLKDHDPNRITVATSEYFLHPDYNPDTLENDLGLIKLRMPVTFTDYIRPIAPLAMHELPAKPNLRVIGWGESSIEDPAYSNELQVVEVVSLTNDECRITYGNQIKDKMVCAVGQYNEGPCFGDVGSPLLDAYSKYVAVHVGIVSFLSSNGCGSTDPSGFTRTYPYVNWIHNITTN